MNSEQIKDMTALPENGSESEFYPTPDSLIDLMLAGVKLDRINNILEPSAGKGDIIKRIFQKVETYSYNRIPKVDAIEIDANLRQILKYNFSSERKQKLIDEREAIFGKYPHASEWYMDGMSTADKVKVKQLGIERDSINPIYIVHDDFLTYQPFKRYDLIIMNPPFSNGATHLLKAIDIQKRGGAIICLLNAETIRNPYTYERKTLIATLEKLGAEITYHSDMFKTAERKTAVEVALIKIYIPPITENSEIFDRLSKAEKLDEFSPETSTELEVIDYIKAMVARFNVEVKAGLELIRTYKALAPKLAISFDNDSYSQGCIIQLKTNKGEDLTENAFVEDVRGKYWKALFSSPKFIEKLTTQLQCEWRNKVGDLRNYDFSEYNINALTVEMNCNIKQGIEDALDSLFDKLTAEHSYYAECTQNVHYYNGWTTNKAHKIGKKVILPNCNIFSSWSGEPRSQNAYGFVRDIEMCLNYLDGNMTAEVNAWECLKTNIDKGTTAKIPLKYFNVTFYKKGTMHLEFTCPKLIERFNIFMGQRKNWLPPCYGQKTYGDMTDKEKATVDSFQGETAYNKVMEKSTYYLAPAVKQSTLLLAK